MDKRFDHKLAQTEIIKKWDSQQTYSMKNNPGTPYSIDTPPPTVSGNLHIGHIFSYTQTDIIARYKRMSGYSVFYPFGFDDNGLPTERYVEKKKKIRAHQLPRSEFIQECLDVTKEVEASFKHLWQQIGLSVDWQNEYSTISKSSRRISQASFIELYKKNYLYRHDEPALYCTTCRTSVAQAELDDKEVPSFFNDIVFKDSNDKDLIIGTTRPELLPSCVALLYNPSDTRYKHLKGTNATVPLFGFEVPIIQDELVEIEKGTGLVMCCTFGDSTDVTWFKTHNLPFKQSIGFDGKLLDTIEHIGGLKVADARKKIIELLKEKNLLLQQKEIVHNVNVHERCKKEIEFVVLKQWFVKILEYKQTFLDLAEQINWSPTFMKSRYINWVENLNWDWCISRQRFYGIPFPVWHCTKCNEIILANIDQLPIDPQETKPPVSKCPKCDCNDLQPDTDVMDTWNTSSLTPYLCYELFSKNDKLIFNQEDVSFLPMSMRPQAHDIIRTWAFYTIVKTWMHNKVLPWKDIIISGHVLADSKEKLSKSKNQKKLAPEKLLEQYPADAIRYWTASGSLGHDVAFSESQLKIGLKLITKLWNAFKFAKTHIDELKNPHEQPKELGLVNEWILDAATQAFNNYKNYFEKNEFGLALAHVERFFWADFCDNYLELIKHQLFNPDEYTPQEVHATRWTLYHVGLRILQLYAPYLPFLTETLFETIYAQNEQAPSIHQTQFNVVQKEFSCEQSATLMHAIITIISAVRKLKSEQQLSLKVPIETLEIFGTDNELLDQLKQHESLLRGVTQAEKFTFTCDELKTNELKQVDEKWHGKITIN